MNRIISTPSGDREILGFVAVDSGQIVIADPCYVQEYWRKDASEADEIVYRRLYRHRDTGAELQYQRDFDNYQSPIPSQGGRCMNELNATGEWEKVPNPRQPGLSYAAACSATLGDEDGQLIAPCKGIAAGSHFAVGVASSTGWGDGCYPVIAERDADGRVARLVIDFLAESSELLDEEDRLQDMEQEIVDRVVELGQHEPERQAA